MVEARQRSILWMLGVTLLVSVSFGWGAQAVEAVVAQPPVADTGPFLDYLITSVPEIREMARKNPDNRLILSVESAPDPQAAERADREFYRVYVGFYVQDGGPGHRSRWATFLVHREKTEILWANVLADNAYISLSDWRQYVHASPAAGDNDWMCLPFLRIGPIHPDSSIDDLVKAFGEGNVQRRTVYGPEGAEKFAASVIFPDTANELIVFWQDNQYGSLPSSVSIRKQGSAWKTVQGIRIGSTLAELNEMNRRPFSFYGFGWDYGGSISNEWDGGVMASVRGVSLVLRATRELPRYYYGDKELKSNLETLLPDGARVSRIDVQMR